MAEKTTAGSAAGLSRREMLSAGAMIPVGLATPGTAPAQQMPNVGTPVAATATPTHETKENARGSAELVALETLNVVEMELLEAVCARLIPADEHGPGATEARAAQYTDRALAGPLRNQRGAYAAGLSALDAYARSAKGKPFPELPPADQDAVLHDLQGGQATGFTPSSAAFFNLVRGHAVEGTFCDPYYGGNANFVGWDLVRYPGLRMVVTAEDQRFRKPEALRQSAYSPDMFGRGHG